MNLKDIAIGTIDYPLETVQADESTTREVQSRLLSWGYKPGPADGDWGMQTTGAYEGYAREFDYPEDLVTPRAAAQLLSFAFRSLSAIAKQSSTFNITALRDNPLIAKEIQQALTKLGYKPGPVDGDWGKSTQAAYAEFAKANQFPIDKLSPNAAKQLIGTPTPTPTPPPIPPTPTPTPIPPPVITPIPAPVVTPIPAPVITPIPSPVVTPLPPPVDGIPTAPTDAPVPINLTAIRRGTVRWPLTRLTAVQDLVKEIQGALSAMGHYGGAIDGLWGSRSQQGYEQCCRRYGELVTTGISPRMAKLLLEPEVPNIKSPEKPIGLGLGDYQAAAKVIGCDVPTIRAVVEVEAGSSGYFNDGRPKILFEAHWFSAFTDGRYDFSNGDISSPVWDRSLYIGGVGEWDRLYKAIGLDRAGALKSASWGLGQVMGFNHQAAGYSDVETFVRAMHESEGKQLTAMFNFIRSNDLAGFLVRRDWAGFALRYNGPGYRVNEYDLRLADAYAYWATNNSTIA